MIATHRRFNIAQAQKLSGLPWCTMEDLRRCGAYGSARSIHNAMRLMMLKEDAAAVAKKGGVWIYRITPTGYAKLGMVPHKEEDHNGRRNETEGADIPRD